MDSTTSLGYETSITTTTMTWWEETTVNGVATNVTTTTTATPIAASSMLVFPFPPSWSVGTTNSAVVWQYTATVYASETGTPLPGDATSSDSLSTTAISSAAANGLAGYAGDNVGGGFPGVVALAACFAAMGVALFGRRIQVHQQSGATGNKSEV